ncbi:beta-galactosidase [Bianquea renquensis]|uniref:Beta-galactosidase n=1 Tax=Bianquea renquensis TaxID=2763661 RepID=A0A926I1L8_9FIRM|nr:beta-galactosidase [Bianquea renquensis]MBC8543141.1 beta-galactosidase [Bianquea renquensis]
MDCKVCRKDGNLQLLIDGEPQALSAYMTYNPRSEEYAAFAKAGVQIFSMGVYVGDRGINSFSGIHPFREGYCKGPGVYDFTQVDEDMERICRERQDARIIIRIDLDSPIWWDLCHPEELFRNYSGKSMRQSFVSVAWRDAMGTALCALIRHVEASHLGDNVIGYQVAAGKTEEWLYHLSFIGEYGDYSEINRQRFIQWLQEQYGEIQNLNIHWNQHYEDFSDISLPHPFRRSFCTEGVLRNPGREQDVIDFYQYHSEMMADAILYFCRRVKQETGGRRITGAFYGYVGELMDGEYGHHALGKLLESPDLDFLASPNSYMELRAPGIDWPFMSAVDSAFLHGKLWFIESDTRTNLTQPLASAMPSVCPDNPSYDFQGVWKGPESAELSLSLLQKGFGKVLTGRAGTWWFDMWGGWYHNPIFMDFMKTAHGMMEEDLLNPAGSAAQIAVILDDRSYAYFGLNTPVLSELVYSQRQEFGKMGAPFHTYLLQDLLHPEFPAGDYRMIIFLNTIKQPDDIRQAIQKRLQRDQKTLVFIYLQDRYDQHNKIRKDPITGFSVEYREEDEPVQACYRGVTFPPIPVSCPRFTKKDFIPLGYWKDTSIPAVGMQVKPEYTSVYSLAPHLPASLLMDLAMHSGVHLFSLTQDVIYANDRYLFIHASQKGSKRLYFPSFTRVSDVFSERQCAQWCTFMDFEMEQYETRAFRYEPQ